MTEKIKKMRPVVRRKYVTLISDLFIGAYSQTKLYQKVYFGNYYVSGACYDDVYYYGQNAWDFGYALLEREFKEPLYLDKVFSNIYTLGNNLLRLSKKINKKDYSNSSWLVLKKDFDNFIHHYQIFALSILGFNLQYPVEDYLSKLLFNREEFIEELALLSSPSKDNIYIQEQRSLLNLGLKINRNKNYDSQSANLKKLLKAHLKKYAWIYYRGGEGKILKEKDVFKQVLKNGPNYSQSLKKIALHKINIKKKSELLINQLQLNKQQKRMVTIAKELSYFRTYRTDYLNWSFFNILPLLSKIGKKLNLNLSQVVYSRIEELSEARPEKKDILKKRKDKYFIMNYFPDEVVFSDQVDQINILANKYLKQDEGNEKNIKGRPAFPGKVINNICVIKEKRDFKKMKKNMILVTAMTTPDYIQLMKIASAIVTDEGGITCHAAIVARELKTPCIIGTKIATKVLKDGDLVEVDANKGEVRIIKKK